MSYKPVQGIDDAMDLNDDGSPVSGAELFARMLAWEEANASPRQQPVTAEDLKAAAALLRPDIKGGRPRA